MPYNQAPDSWPTPGDHVTEPLEAVPAKPKHKVGQLTTAELAMERRRLEAALRRPFSADIKALLQVRLDAVLAERKERARKRAEGIAAAKADATKAVGETGGGAAGSS